MYRNYFKLAYRNIIKNPTFSLLNTLGWAMGMAVCILMLLFVRHEHAFDEFHTKADRIFRLTEFQRLPGMQEQQVPMSMLPMGPAFAKDYPEIETFVRLRQLNSVVLRHGDRQILAEEAIQADSTFLQVFDFETVRGDRPTALRAPSGLVLTESTAKQLFNTDDVVGKIVEVNYGDGFLNFAVSAVLQDLPETSHLQFDAVLPLHELAGKMQDWMKDWDSNWLITYLLFRENSRPERVSADFQQYKDRYLGEQKAHYDLAFQALKDIHLGSTNITHDDLNYKKFDGRYTQIFGWLAAFVMLIASFNFINLTTARASRRAREVGMRKAIGASRMQLIAQFTGEALLIALLSFVVALALVAVGLPALEPVIDRKLSLPLLSDPIFLPATLGVTLLTGLLAGVYPAFVATAFKPVTALKGEIKATNRSFSLRSVLVVAQFAIATALIMATLLAVRQLNFIREKDLGFRKSQVVQIPMNETANKKFEAIRETLLKNPDILEVTGSSQRLGDNLSQMGLRCKIGGEERKFSVSQLMVTYNYPEFFGFEFLAGRTFSKAMAADAGHGFIINEAFAKEIGMAPEALVGSPFKTGWQDEWGTLIGVVKDFNFNSLHYKVAPVCMSIQPWDFFELSVKINPKNTAVALQTLQNTWSRFVPDLPYDGIFLDEHFATLYQTDTQVSKVVGISSFLATLIACMGLFGLALFLVETRTKEIGIRKVLGASVAGITSMLAKDFLKLVAIAIVIAIPVAWYFMDYWLSDFAYRIKMQWWMFAGAGVAAILVAFLTVSFQSIRAALANPVESLRSE